MKSITKTIMIAASAFALCFGLTACGGGGQAAASGSTALSGSAAASAAANGSASSASSASSAASSAAPAASKATDFYMFKAEMPEGYAMWGPNGKESPLNIVEFRSIENSNKLVDVEIDDGTAQEQFDKKAAKDKYTAGQDVKLGKYTWKTLDLTWNKQPSVVMYTDIADGLYAEVTLYETTLDDAAVKAFLEGAEFTTDYETAHKAGMDTTVEKFASDNNLKLWEDKK